MIPERRATPRARCLFGGFIAFNQRKTTMDCLVRNLSPEGALLTFPAGALAPERFELQVAQLGRPVQARVLWRKGERYGVSFSAPMTKRQKPGPLDLAGRLKDFGLAESGLRLRCT